MLETYRRSLKMPEAEELFDLMFYRTLAYLLVVPLSKTPITPNQVTVLSLVAGLIAAYYFSTGVPTALMLGAIWYALANILDCADGQLARINKSGTPLGRVVDGVADYISSVAIFLGIGFGLEAQGNPQWLLVIAAGISSAIHAIKFDEVQSAYIAYAKGETGVTGKEIEKYSAQLEVPSISPVKRLTLTLYLMYLKLQRNTQTSKPETQTSVRFWSWLGPTTNRTLLIVAALFGNIYVFLYGVTLVGNVYFFLLSTFMRRR
ncbi:MAG: CDP-alcohol phosphatidyltransferase family protein [Ignavibacteriae bacterium]|nr:CDP-alcohol phosphatidyltransferase family protein [Ignavibacteriota bacterium]